MTPHEQLFRAMQAHATAADQFTFEPQYPRLTIALRFDLPYPLALIEVKSSSDGWLSRTNRAPWVYSESGDDAVKAAFAAARKIPDGAVVVTEVGTLPGCGITSELVEPTP